MTEYVWDFKPKSQKLSKKEQAEIVEEKRVLERKTCNRLNNLTLSFIEKFKAIDNLNSKDKRVSFFKIKEEFENLPVKDYEDLLEVNFSLRSDVVIFHKRKLKENVTSLFKILSHKENEYFCFDFSEPLPPADLLAEYAFSKGVPKGKPRLKK